MQIAIDIIEKIIRECFESEDMKEYLIAHHEVLSGRQFSNIIAGAMIPLSKKAELMKEVDNAAYLDIKEALDALDLKPGQFFIFTAEKNGITNGDTEPDSEYIGPCTSIERAKRYICENYYELPKEASPWSHRLDQDWWFSLELFEIKDDGKLFNSFTYYLIADEICYFEKGLYTDEEEFYSSSDLNYSLHCIDLNISIPFKPGDIVTIDGRPFCKPKQVLLLEVCDDCCGVWALYMKADGSWDTGAVKHGTVYDIGRNGRRAPLYRMEKYDGILSEDEQILENISAAIKKQERLIP